MRILVACGLLAVTLIACDGIGSTDSSPVPIATRSGPADYTVLAKAEYGINSASGKRGAYVTIWLFGSQQETEVSYDCYGSARVGSILPTNCR